MLISADGNGVVEPSWKPNIFGPYSQSDIRCLFSKSGLFDNYTKFYFYHADLGPSNIIVKEDGSIVGIIDWESAAFYPMFWLGTKPLVSAGFLLRGEKEKKRA